MYFKLTTAFLLSFLLAAAPLQGQQMQMMPTPEETEDQVVATVDGEEIYMSQLREAGRTQILPMQMMQINPMFGQFLQTEGGQKAISDYKAFVLNTLIDETLLAQKAGREGIEVSQEEVDRRFEEHLGQIKAQHGLSEAELQEALQQQGISSMQEYKQIFVQQSNLEEQKLLEEEGIEDVHLEEYVQQLREEAEIEIKLNL